MSDPSPRVPVLRRPWRVWILSFLALLLAAPVAGQAYEALSPAVRAFVDVSAPYVLIRDVRLIDGTGAPARDGVSVLLVRGRIDQVGASGEVTLPPGADPSETAVVEGAGHTLIPGLVMLHEHLFYPSGQRRYNTNEVSFPPLYLAGGVTTMRTGGSVDPYTDLRTRELIDAGRVVGPTMDVTGPYLEGPGGFVRAMPQLESPEAARQHVEFWMDQGVTSFKAYNLIRRDVLAAAIEAAHARGAKVTGHLCSVTYGEAAALGIDNLEHGFFAATDWFVDKEPDVCPRGNPRYEELDLEGREFLDVVDDLVEAGVALTSTLTVIERGAPGRPMPPEGAFQAMLPQLRDRVRARLGVVQRSEGDDAALRRFMEMERIFFQRGGHLVVGTDPTGGGDVVPGHANQRALQLLLEVGLSVEEAVMVATLNGARYLEAESRIGTVEEGKVADLVLMAGNPGEDPEAFRAMTLVFKDGVGYSSPRLFEAGTTGTVGVR